MLRLVVGAHEAKVHKCPTSIRRVGGGDRATGLGNVFRIFKPGEVTWASLGLGVRDHRSPFQPGKGPWQ